MTMHKKWLIAGGLIFIGLMFVVTATNGPNSDCQTVRCRLQQDAEYGAYFDSAVPVFLGDPSRAFEGFLAGTDEADRPFFERFLQQVSANARDRKFPGATFKSCAVIGNSPNLLGKGYGELIDSHDAVIRMNRGPTKGYESDVGTKTTFRVSYSPYYVNEAKEGSTFLIYPHPRVTRRYRLVVDSDTRYWDYIDVIARVMEGNIPRGYKPSVYFGRNTDRLPKKSMLVFSPEFMGYVEKNWFRDPKKPADAPPTSGITSLVFAFHVCDSISAFGFGEDRTGRYTHYFGSEKHNAHRPVVIPSVRNNQNRLLSDLARKKIITLYFPDPGQD